MLMLPALGHFCVPVIFVIFQNYEDTGYLCNIMFIFDSCHCSCTVETPDKYEHYLKYLIYTFALSKFPATEKSKDRALVTPPYFSSGPLWHCHISDIYTVEPF